MSEQRDRIRKAVNECMSFDLNPEELAAELHNVLKPWILPETSAREEYQPFYALIRTHELASVFDDAQDGDVAAEAIYLDHLNLKLAPYGITVVEIEMPDNRTGELAAAIKAALEQDSA